jgi:hypothetical protein
MILSPALESGTRAGDELRFGEARSPKVMTNKVNRPGASPLRDVAPCPIPFYRICAGNVKPFFTVCVLSFRRLDTGARARYSACGVLEIGHRARNACYHCVSATLLPVPLRTEVYNLRKSSIVISGVQRARRQCLCDGLLRCAARHIRCTLFVLLCLVLYGARGNAAFTESEHATDADTTKSIESLARDGMVHALLGNTNGLSRVQRQAEFLTNTKDGVEEPRSVHELEPRALLHHLSLLSAWTAPSDAERRSILRQLAAEGNVPAAVKREARDALAHEPLERLRRLEREDAYNRTIHAVNLPIQMTFAVLTVNPQAIYDTVVSLLFIWEPLGEVSARERASLVLQERWMREKKTRRDWGLGQKPEGNVLGAEEEKPLASVTSSQPAVQSPQSENPQSAIHNPQSHASSRLQKRLTSLWVRQALAEADWHMENDRWEEARRTYAQALELQPENKVAWKGRLEAATHAEQVKRMRQESLEPFPTRDATSGSLGARKQAELRTTNGIQGECEAALRKAEKDRHSALLAYTFFGTVSNPDAPPRLPKENRLHRVAHSINILLPFQWVLRGAAATFGHPIPDDAWRAAAVHYLKQTGDWRLETGGTALRDTLSSALSPQSSPSVPTVYSLQSTVSLSLRLAASYERLGWYNEAAFWHKQALGRDDPEYASRLDEKAAKALLESAKQRESPERRRVLLQQVAQRFGATKAANKARDLLTKMDKEQADWTRISKKELLSWPDLWRGRALRLDPAWLDGRKQNGELSKEGVRLAPDGKTLGFVLWTLGGREETHRELDVAQTKETHRELEVWRREVAVRERAKQTEPSFDDWIPPLAVEGSGGTDGLDFWPRLLPLPPDPTTLPLYLPATE